MVKKHINGYAVSDEANRNLSRCVSAILPYLGLSCKRENRGRQPGESWEKARAIQMQNVRKTFSAHRGTMFEGLRKEEALITQIATLLSYSCPRQAIVHAFGLDEHSPGCHKSRCSARPLLRPDRAHL